MITLIAWGAPDHVEVHRSPGQVVAVVAILAAVSVLPIALRGTRIDRGMVIIVASAIGFGASSVLPFRVGELEAAILDLLEMP